ncbi:MAG: ATP-binding protein, partial [Proteobacteria bacterium]|nr:ATP-binding protein [Pseudomonadota bacterium]
KLVRHHDKADIDLNDLSSGEKVLISLVLALYNNDFEPDIPGVLLLEEPDAPLHPAMIKQFLDVIIKLFIQEKGIKVVMTSHSPVTVALAPDSSLFEMNRVGKRVEKTSKDKAIKVLTAGIPSFSMNYDNRRQVFVESKHDVTFYERVYQKLSVFLDKEISLHFISSGVGGQGDCNQVREIVNKLSSFGNTSIYGIIDWDGKNNGNNFVNVLGKNHRYSIENYIFDPILLAAFLLREKFIRRESIGLQPSENYTDFKNFENFRIQQIADYIEGRIRPHYEHSRRELDFNCVAQQKVEYVGGNSIRISNLLLVNQGHTLEERIKDAFPQLKRYQVEGQLKKEIILKVIDDIPEFLSVDLLKIFVDIQKGFTVTDS